MLTVTENAKEELKRTLLAHTDDPEKALRLKLKELGQLGLVLGREAEGDCVIEQDGFKVLLVGSDIAELVEDVTIDVRDTPDGPKLSVLRK